MIELNNYSSAEKSQSSSIIFSIEDESRINKSSPWFLGRFTKFYDRIT